MKWICPICSEIIDKFPCSQCSFAPGDDLVFDFSSELSDAEQAEDSYRKKMDTSPEALLKQKKGTINYHQENIFPSLDLSGTVLDLGAGFCWLGALIDTKFSDTEVICSDVSLKGLEAGKDLGEHMGADIKAFVRAQAYALPFADNSFDVVVSHAFLHHVDDLRLTLKEIYRVLKPGGKYIATGEPASARLFMPLYRVRLERALANHPGVNENTYTFTEWKEFFNSWPGMKISYLPPEHEKFTPLWAGVKRIGLLDKILFSNIRIDCVKQ
ncbi:class I SAM-dependent methyltransferase [Patescibacteria group bacterium]|nr:class I SAM-dependent methyltransferase [Patescibacteria group bacterium]MBU1673739.1 class I SAM-dependent methyltransferase [Patescibacteria group bacterium]MBU1963105.1 class I SAM-dependent methyltransferase [Patescibacteria group bacterium]